MTAQIHEMRLEIDLLKQTTPLVARAKVLQQDFKRLKTMTEETLKNQIPHTAQNHFECIRNATEHLRVAAELACTSYIQFLTDMNQLHARRIRESQGGVPVWSLTALEDLMFAHHAMANARGEVARVLPELQDSVDAKLAAAKAIVAGDKRLEAVVDTALEEEGSDTEMFGT